VNDAGFGWFDLTWPWIGLCLAVVMIAVLFATNLVRDDVTGSRWRDLRWLSFLAVAVYMVHQVEEHGLAANGVGHAFPDELCSALGQPPYPGCAIPPLFYLAVNISLVWIAAPVAALLSTRFPLVGMGLWGVIAVNALVHIGPSIATLRYDAGVLTSFVLFVPLSVVAARAVLIRYRRVALLVLVFAGMLMHAVLGGGLMLFLHGEIPAWVLVAAQPGGIIVGYLVIGLAGRRLRRQWSSGFDDARRS